MKEDVARLLDIIQEAKKIIGRIEDELNEIQRKQKLRNYDDICLGNLKFHSERTRILSRLCELFECNLYEVEHKTVADLLEYRPYDVLRVRYFGKALLDALQDALRLEGVVWK